MHFVEGADYLIRDITAASLHTTADVAVGKMDYHVVNATGRPLMNKVPVLSAGVAKIPSRVVTYAYPESDVEFGEEAVWTFRPDFYSGELIGHSDAARDSCLVAWPHYVTSIDLLGGASGGPVFDENGQIIGINCVGGLGPSYSGRVAELLPLDVPEFPLRPPRTRPYTVVELGREGLIKFNPPL